MRKNIMNSKRSSEKLASDAARTMTDPQASAIQKSLAAGVLAQRDASKQTGARMEDIASKVLRSDKYAEKTKSFAASLLSQSNKER